MSEGRIAQLMEVLQMSELRFDGKVAVVTECAVTGEVFTVGAGQVSRFFLARSAGYYNRNLSPELVRDHLEQIRDTSACTVPADTGDETAQLLQAIAAQSH